MNIFHDQFSTGQVIAATGVSNATLQSWLKRDLIIGHKTSAPIAGGGTPGAHRRYSFFNVMEIAVAKALLDAGAGNVSDAFKAASHFAHTGQGPLPGLSPERAPGLPFTTSAGGCLTLVCMSGNMSLETPYQPGCDFYANVRNRLGPGCVVLEVNGLFERVTARLGYDFRDVLKDAYRNLAE